MPRSLADFHVHSVASQDGFSTVSEICLAAKEQGLSWVAVTDHGPGLPIGQHIYHFEAMTCLPQTIHGVKLIKGIEANVLADGNLDISSELAQKMELVIAAYHPVLGHGEDAALNTARLVRLLDSGQVDVLAHLYYPLVKLDLPAVIESMAKNNVALELNEKALAKASEDSVQQVVKSALSGGLKFVLGSDAHFHDDVGVFDLCFKVIDQYNIPASAIINLDHKRLQEFLGRRCT